MRPLLPLSAVLLVVALSAAAQVRESVTVSVVEVPVTVVDKAGNPIRGLTAANFQILDEGQHRDITSFEQIDFRSQESMKAVSPLNPAARRNFLLLFDLSYSNPTAIGRAQKAARDFIARGAQQRDRVAVGTVDADKGFRLLTAFTTDRKLLLSAIASPRAFRGSDPLQIASTASITLETPAVVLGPQGEGRGLAADNMVDIVRGSKRNDSSFRRQRVERQMSALADLAAALRGLSGQKHVVLLSEGFDPAVVQGRGQVSQESLEENEAVERGEVWKVDNDARYGNSTSLTLLRRMAETFKRSDVILHAVDIQGLRVDNDAETGRRVNSNDGLYLLAESTGGTVMKNSNDMSGNLERMARSQEVVYVASFRAPSGQPGKFHNLKVKLLNVPGGHLQHRAGYYEAGAETSVERSLSSAEVVLNDIAQSDIHVAALAAPFLTSGKNSQVPVILEIDGPDLLKAAGGQPALVDILVYAFDEEGIVRDRLFDRLRIQPKEAGEQLRRSGVKNYGTLSLPPGNYAIKGLVRVLESDLKGFVRRDIVVADAGEVAISQPLFIEPAGQWLMVKGRSNDKSGAPYPFEVNGESFIPSATVAMKSGQPRRFVVFVQNAEPDELTLETLPQARLLTQLRSESGGTKLVFQLDQAAANTDMQSIIVRRKGSADERKSSIPLVVQ
ncbi:MAG: VWFA-related protein [Acidobacteria bacterium]|nr:VWFA-related protein [Acidobacteriota bacterium]